MIPSCMFGLSVCFSYSGQWYKFAEPYESNSSDIKLHLDVQCIGNSWSLKLKSSQVNSPVTFHVFEM